MDGPGKYRVLNFSRRKQDQGSVKGPARLFWEFRPIYDVFRHPEEVPTKECIVVSV
jgi:hypothetical protein